MTNAGTVIAVSEVKQESVIWFGGEIILAFLRYAIGVCNNPWRAGNKELADQGIGIFPTHTPEARFQWLDELRKIDRLSLTEFMVLREIRDLA
jgi:hypothetical protein